MKSTLCPAVVAVGLGLLGSLSGEGASPGRPRGMVQPSPLIAVPTNPPRVKPEPSVERVAIRAHAPTLGLGEVLTAAYTNSHPGLAFTFSEATTPDAIHGLITGGAAAFMAEGRLSARGNALHVAAKGLRPEEYWVATECLAIYVNADNPVEQITVDQLRSIYLGTLRNWKQVGGPDIPVAAYGLPDDSMHGRLMLDRVLGGRADVRKLQPVPGDAALRRAVGRDKAGIGFGSLAAAGEGIKLLKVAERGPAMLPEPLAVRTGTYPLSRPVYVYLGQKSPAAARSFVTWLQGNEAQKIVEQHGHVSITPILRLN